VPNILCVPNAPAGAEVLLSGPTLWGTQLQLPPGWADAVLAAEPPEDGLTLQDLQVGLLGVCLRPGNREGVCMV
jgi:hypothetical protein